MHELSVTENLMKTAEKYALKNNAAYVTEISVEIGEVSGIVPECLQTYHSLLKDDYPLLKNSVLKTKMVPSVCRCKGCGGEYNPHETAFKCPNCGSESAEIVSGYDMVIKSVTIKEKDNKDNNN